MNLRYTDEQVRYLASTQAVASRGEELFQCHALDPIQFILKDHYFFKYELKGGVMGNHDYYEMRVTLNNQGLVSQMHCDCAAFQKYQGCCKHLVALLLTAKLLESEGDAVWEDEKQLRVLQQTQDILYFFKNQTEANEHLIKEFSKVELRPKLKVVNDAIELDVLIGRNRMYVVKDLILFTQLVKEQQHFSYGAELSFVHHKDSFTEESQPFLDFILNNILDYMQIHQLPRQTSLKSLPIYQQQFELLVQLFMKQSLTVQTATSKNNLLFLTDESLPLHYDVEKENEHLVLTGSVQPNFMYETERHTYIFTDHKIYQVETLKHQSSLPLLKNFYENSPQLRLTREDMTAFISYVLPQIKHHMNHDVVDRLYEDYDVYPLHITLYLDLNEQQALLATIYFTYGDTQFSVTEEEVFVDVIRDRIKEKAFLTQLYDIGFKCIGDVWLLEDENKVYEFMTVYLPLMAKRYEVHGSDAFKTLKIKKTKPLRIGVRMDQHLLAFSFQDLPFDRNEYQAILEKYQFKKKYHRLKDGSFLDLESEEMQTLFELVSSLDLEEDDLYRDEIEMSRYRALYLNQILQKKSIKAKKDKTYQKFVSDFLEFDEQDIPLPDALQATLRPYQETGYRWLCMLQSYGLGGILADDMGLGKTIQIIALLCRAFSQQTNKPSIIVTPSSLVYNWASEFSRFAPHLSPIIVSGTKAEREVQIKSASEQSIFITSYDTLRRDVSSYQMQFQFVILDEAQYIKNQQTQNAKAVKKLEALHRFALTGTPLENSVSDLWSIFDFILPGYLLTYPEFKQTYEVQIVKHQNIEMLQRVQQLVAPFILRRLKRDVLTELPDKIETVVYCELKAPQRKLYDATLLKMNHELQDNLDSVGLNQMRIKMLAMLMRLRQLCAHPSLYVENYEHESAKLELCLEIIQESIESQHRILLFSQFTSMFELLKPELEKLDIPYYVLTGQTSAKERLRLTQAFNEGDVPIFLISLKAGGTGLNLTGADVVIHYDPWWNKSAENQATDRAYRIGQTNKVQVFKLIAKDTIEEKIEKMQRRKLELSDSLVQEGEQFISQLSTEEVQDLFNRDE